MHSFLFLIFLSPALYFLVYKSLLFYRSGQNDLKDSNGTDAELLNELQEQKMKELEVIAHRIAHEIKNPLAIILQGVEYLKDKLKAADGNVLQVLKFMGNSIIRADNVIEGLLEFASLPQFVMQPQDLNVVMEKTLSVMQTELDRYRIRVDKQLAIDLPLVKIDKKRMEQVFVNILLNALQAMPEGGALNIETGLKSGPEKRKTVFIEIMDTGTGIPKESLERVFNLFFTTKREKGSRGLGLAISRQIMRTHGGGIAIENRVGSPGVKVTLTLPV